MTYQEMRAVVRRAEDQLEHGVDDPVGTIEALLQVIATLQRQAVRPRA